MRIYNAHMAHASHRAKVATNLSVRSDLVGRAKELKINISEVLEEALQRAIRNVEREAWLESNQAAIESYNARVEERGVFSDDWRKF
jgi:antitoxin CcdA